MGSQEETIRFAEIVFGVRIMEGSPPAGSRLARFIELDRECEAAGLSDEEFHRRADELFG